MKKQYQVNVYDYEFQTKADDQWSSQDLIDAYNSETCIDVYTIATFDRHENAIEYARFLNDKNSEPYLSRVTVGYVITGNIYVVQEIEVEDYDQEIIEYGDVQYFAKGKSDE